MSDPFKPLPPAKHRRVIIGRMVATTKGTFNAPIPTEYQETPEQSKGAADETEKPDSDSTGDNSDD